MNKQEILNEIEKTKEHLANMEKLLKECECESWKPQDGQVYYYVDGQNDVQSTNYIYSEFFNCDKKRCSIYNCFKTKEEAEAEAEKILVRRMLEDIAKRLNKGQKIDWSDENQYKWYIIYNTTFGFATYSVSENTTQGAVYCLDKSFLDVAIQEIGEERLKKYLRGE